MTMELQPPLEQADWLLDATYPYTDVTPTIELVEEFDQVATDVGEAALTGTTQPENPESPA